MNRSYYQTAFDFERFFEQKEMPKLTLRESIAQYITLVITTCFGEYTHDDEFGSLIWETDFDLLANTNTLKEDIRKSLLEKLKEYENRTTDTRVEVSLGENLSNTSNRVRLKKYLTVNVETTVRKTNERLRVSGDYMIAPLAYKG